MTLSQLAGMIVWVTTRPQLSMEELLVLNAGLRVEVAQVRVESAATVAELV